MLSVRDDQRGFSVTQHGSRESLSVIACVMCFVFHKQKNDQSKSCEIHVDKDSVTTLYQLHAMELPFHGITVNVIL